MRLDLPKVLTGFQATLFTKVVPALGSDYSAGSTGVIGLCLSLAAQETDRAAELLATANAEMRVLFAEASWVRDVDLAARLRDAAAAPEGPLRVSALGAVNDTLNELLIDLHAHVENQPCSEARETERRILAYLEANAQRELLELPPM